MVEAPPGPDTSANHLVRTPEYGLPSRTFRVGLKPGGGFDARSG
jgi:hypothetical protein